MFVDTSAVMAILKQEDGWMALAKRLEQTDKAYVSPLVIWEAVVGLVKEAHISFDDAEELVDGFMQEIAADILSITPAIAKEALAASRLYGRTRHKADLNFGDCFSYAFAKVQGVPLLYKGNDFAQTDLG